MDQESRFKRGLIKVGSFLHERILMSVWRFFKQLVLGIYNFFKRLFLGIVNFFPKIYHAIKEEPKAALKGISSFLLPGLGQVRNKQWYKALPIFLVFFIFILIEIFTSNYIYAISGEIQEFPAAAGEPFYFFRDYGGFFTKGIWGLFTLGKLVLGDTYRGETIVIFDKIFTWKSADNSQVLLGEGTIAISLLLLLGATWYFAIKDAFQSHIDIRETGEVEDYKTFIRRVWDDFFAYIIIIPAVILIVFFTLIPFLFSFLVAFTSWTGRVSIGEQLFSWQGLETFKLVFANPDWLKFFGDVLWWTIFYAFMSSVTVYVLGLIQALIIESKYVVFKRFFRVMLIIPWAIPALISLMLFRNVFADNFGLMNQILYEADMTDTVREFLRGISIFGKPLVGQASNGNVLWLTSPDNGLLAKSIIIIVNLWIGYPYFMMLTTGVLGTIPASLYEAADIDGATDTQKFRYITFPWVLRATAPVIITTFTFNFNNFGAIYFLSGGGPGYPTEAIPQSVRVLGAAPGQTDILISWIYKLTFQSTVNQYNLASVYSILIFIFIGLVAVYNLSKLKSFWEEE
ncbi:MAG: ABC transporter permease subunit [Candidatus Izemoplasma sp.]|nr:ABC transporter permease subunit [Candidatus Izemoplasma sp.]